MDRVSAPVLFSFFLFIGACCAAAVSPLENPWAPSVGKRQWDCHAVVNGEGEPCDYDSNTVCNYGLVCWSAGFPSTSGTCIRDKTWAFCTANTDCGPYPGTCYNGQCLFPDNFVQLPGGFPCTRNIQCESNLCQNGLCAAKPPSSPCGGASIGLFDCDLHEYCNNATGLCSPRIPVGGSCGAGVDDWTQYLEECEFGSRCDVMTSKTCVPFLSIPDGGACFENLMCSSGWCDCKNHTCKGLQQLNSTVGNPCTVGGLSCGKEFGCNACTNECYFNAHPAATRCQAEFQASNECRQQYSLSFQMVPMVRETCPVCIKDGIATICTYVTPGLASISLHHTCLPLRFPCHAELYALDICSFNSVPSGTSVLPPCEGLNPSTSVGSTVTHTGTTASSGNTITSTNTGGSVDTISPSSKLVIALTSPVILLVVLLL